MIGRYSPLPTHELKEKERGAGDAYRAGSAIGETSSSAFPSEGSETEPNPEEKRKIHHRIGRDLQTPNHLIDSKMLVVMEFTIWRREPFQSFCFIVYRVAVPALSESALRQNPFNQERRKR